MLQRVARMVEVLALVLCTACAGPSGAASGSRASLPAIFLTGSVLSAAGAAICIGVAEANADRHTGPPLGLVAASVLLIVGSATLAIMGVVELSADAGDPLAGARETELETELPARPVGRVFSPPQDPHVGVASPLQSAMSGRGTSRGVATPLKAGRVLSR